MERKDLILSLLEQYGPLSREELEEYLGNVSGATILSDLSELQQDKLILREGESVDTKYSIIKPINKDESWLKQALNNPITHVQTSTELIKDEEPLVQLKITNPIVYLKHWWKKVIGNEGVKIKLNIDIKPLTAIGLVVIITALSVGLTTVRVLIKYLPFYPSIQQFVTTPDNSRSTAMEGTLYLEAINNKYYLFTASLPEGVLVHADESQKLETYDNQHVILTGKYNDQLNILSVDTVRALSEVKKPETQLLAPTPSPAPHLDSDTNLNTTINASNSSILY